MPTGRVGLVREFGLLALAGTSPGLASQADGNVHSRSHPWEEALAHLDCRSSEDSHFDPVWEKLKTASVRHRWMGQTFLVPALVGNSNETVSPGKHGVQQSSLPAGLDVEREPVMSAEGLFELCEELLERWYPIVWDSPELFDQVLKRRQPPSDLGGLCYYGLITAIFIYAQFMCERHRDFSTALKMVQASLQMLGARLHLDFIHEASSWPFDSLVLMENRDRLLGLRLGRFFAEEERAKSHIIKSLLLQGIDHCMLLHASEHWRFREISMKEPRVFVLSASSIPQLSPRVPVARTRASWRWTPISRSLWRRRTRSSLTVAVFGVHSTLVLEPATMLKVALLPFVRVQVRVFMRDCPKGYAAWAHHCLLQCQALGDCGASGGSGQLFVDLVHMFEDASAYPDNYYRVADYLELLTQMYRMDPDLQAAPLYVCTSPLMCSLLRAAFEKPLLAYFGMQLHVNLDRQKDQLWLMHFKEMARDRCTNVMAVHNFAMQEQIRYATASQLEVVRPRALYAHAGVRLWRLRSVHDRPKSWDRARAAPLAQRRPQVLIFRSSYLHYSLFVPLLEAHQATVAAQFPLELRMVLKATDFIPFAEMRRFRAAVLFPWDPALMAFYELYSLAGPVVFLPKSAWIFKVQQQTGWIWSQPNGAVELASLAATRKNSRGSGGIQHPSPWWLPEDSRIEDVLHWYSYSDCQRLPHLQRFGSLAELFTLLLEDRVLRQAREGMRRHNRRSLGAGLRWYRDAAAWLLSGPEEKPCLRASSQIR
ncbi:unnamed protein product [Polarella glacialis]|uniref:Uncharacterized protein n=1 Tax=Polarella glacialis TaxID=89957 RepID=A0A813FY33_POLGL|nr:unnamed protein product [Polarella glacialis]